MKTGRSSYLVFWLILILILSFSYSINAAQISGVVFEDANKNLKLDAGEKGISGVVVSNQLDVVKTDASGRYSLAVDDETIIFITKPASYAVPLDKNNLPQFFYIHQPKGSPPLKWKGVDPTGPLPESLNFPLLKSQAAETFDAIVFADTQPQTSEEVDFMRDDVIAELVGCKAAFGITLGDVMFDDFSFADKLNQTIAQIGIPFYNVPGNHDMNYDTPDDHYSLETFKRIFAPPYYSFDYGKVHFIVLDDVEWHGKTEDRRGWYQGMLGKKQLNWLKNDLKLVNPDNLVVLTMHIPIKTIVSPQRSVALVDKEKLFELLKNREHLLLLAGHIHTLEHHFFSEEIGWKGKKPLHQILCATICGSWWSGPKDERGIPIADQRDGAPNGYHIFHFEGNKYSERFKAASKGDDYQLRVSLPPSTLRQEDLPTTKIVVNVFDGSERSIVQCQVDESPSIKMQREVIVDPYIIELYDRYEDTLKSWVKPRISAHIWTAPMPTELKPGLHRIVVRTTDQFGNSYKSAGIFEVE